MYIFYIFKYITAKEWLKIIYEKGDSTETVCDVRIIDR